MEPLVRNMNDTQRSEYVCTVQQRIAELARERPQDTLKKEWLRKFLDRRVRDGVIRRLIGKWLQAGVWEKGQLSYPEDGTPQGGVISPLLANLFLHYAFDMWMAREFPHIPFERYADDAICHCKSAE